MVWSGCYVVSLTWPLCTTYSQAGGRSDLRQGVSLTRQLTQIGTKHVLDQTEIVTVMMVKAIDAGDNNPVPTPSHGGLYLRRG